MPASEAPLKANVAVLRKYDRELRAIINQSAVGVGKEILSLDKKSGIGAATRKARLQIRRRIYELWSKVEDLTERGALDATRFASQIYGEFDKEVLRKLGVANIDEFLERELANAESGVEKFLARKESGYTLSQRVYRNGQESVSKINKIVDYGLTTGQSAAEIAKAVRKYINPDTPGGVRYAAQRLARTEINNAFHYASQERYKANPFVDRVKWHLSGSHPRPDICNEYAEHTDKGYDSGTWTVGEVPARPHPNCLCYTTPEVGLSEDDFMKNLKSGKYDGLYDEYGYVKTKDTLPPIAKEKGTQALPPTLQKPSVKRAPRTPEGSVS